MNKLRYLLIIPALLLGACKSTPSSEAVVSSGNQETTSSVVSSETSTSSSVESIISSITSSSTSSIPSSIPSSSSSSSSSSKEPEINPLVKDSKWGLEAAQACYDAIGDVIPYMDCDGFEYKVTTDDYGDPAIWFYLYYETQEIAKSKITDYAYVAWELGLFECVVKPDWFNDGTYYWQQTALYADKTINPSHAVEIIGLDSVKNYNGKQMGCLGLYCFTYIPNVDKTKFPMNAVDYFLEGYTPVPEIEGEGYEFSFNFSIQDGIKVLQIAVKSNQKSYEMEEEYFYALLKRNYKIAQWDDTKEDFTENWYEDGDTYPEYDDDINYYCYEKFGSFCIYLDYNLYYQTLFLQFFLLN